MWLNFTVNDDDDDDNDDDDDDGSDSYDDNFTCRKHCFSISAIKSFWYKF